MPGVTRSAAAIASRRRRASSSTSFLSTAELCAGILVDEPVEPAVWQGWTNQLHREIGRQLRTLQNRFEGVGLSRATDQEEDLSAGVEQRRGQGLPASVHFWHVIGNGESPVGDQGGSFREE